VLHANAEEGVPIHAIADVIGRHLNFPVASVAPEDAAGHFGFLAGFLVLKTSSSSIAGVLGKQLCLRYLDTGLFHAMLRPMGSLAARETGDVRQSILDAGQRIMGGKGFSAVGLTEILTAAGVPKGSFYHYFGSKDAFGEALLESYFQAYLADLDETIREPGLTMAQRLMRYFRKWQETQSFFDCQGKCLAVKLGAEVADLSEAMRSALKLGTSAIINRLERVIEAGVAEGSLSINGDADSVAQSLYQLWLGASVMVKIVRTIQPFETAMMTTRQILNLPLIGSESAGVKPRMWTTTQK
jgi:TetR/AcrR family transcriptional repressor of nem operon